MTTLTRSDFRFFHRLRVRWAEVDLQKIVFNAHYLMYFDTAMSDYWRALALPYQAAMDQLEGDLYVVKATVEFHASARLDDQVEVALKCSRIGRSSVTFTGAIFRGEEHLITGELIYVFADPASQTSRPVPPALSDILLGYEAGEPMLNIKLGNWNEFGADALRIRTEVLVQDQRLTTSLAHDAADLSGWHAVAYNRLGQAVANGRLTTAAPGVAQVGRMAVVRELRGVQLGQQVLRALTQAARARGDRELVLHSLRHAEGFYERLGYQRRGEPFVDDGIDLIEMFIRL